MYMYPGGGGGLYTFIDEGVFRYNNKMDLRNGHNPKKIWSQELNL